MASETGRCDALVCYPDYITCGGGSCSFGNCSRTFPSNVPIKSLVKGTMISPFVKVRFEGPNKPGTNTPGNSSDWDSTEITTGNLSQPYNVNRCRAAVKSFQYTMGLLEAGTTCKVTIVDELGGLFPENTPTQPGSSLEDWFRRIIRNPQADQINSNQGVYKMKILWGWVIAGPDGECPVDGSDEPIGDISVIGSFYGTNRATIENIPVNNSTTPTLLISSPPCYFIPDKLTVTYQGNKIFFEITGIDTLQRSQQQALPYVSGTDDNKKFFVDAVREIAANAIPPFDVIFKQVNTSGQLEDMKFLVDSGTANSQSGPGFPTNDELRAKGPKRIWRCDEMSPIIAIRQWINTGAVRAESTEKGEDGKGITVTWDACNRNLVLMANAAPLPAAYINSNNRMKAIYIYNGGSCSPVLSFSPTFQANFWATAVGAGGFINPVSNRQSKMSDAIIKDNSIGYIVNGRGPRNTGVVNPETVENIGIGAAVATAKTYAVNKNAAFLSNSIEAELRVQGDPSPYYCSPIVGGAPPTIGLIAVNPFYLGDADITGCPQWQVLSTTSCNRLFSSNAWMLKSVDHQVKDGSYVTTLKIALYVQNAELAAINPITGDAGTLGGDVNTPPDADNSTTACMYGTMNCVELNNFAAGWLYGDPENEVAPGTFEFCGAICQNIGVN